MSAAYTLTDTNDEWYGAVTALCRGADDGEQPVLRVTANGEAVVSTDRPLQKECFSSEDGVLHILGEGGIRGVILTPSSERATECVLHLHVLASSGDWALAFRILRAAIAHGSQVESVDGGAKVTSDAVTEAQAQEHQTSAWAKDQTEIAAKLDRAEKSPDREVESHSAMLPLMGRALMISRGELDLPGDELSELLIDRSRRYAIAYEASLINFPAPQGLKGMKAGEPVYLANFPHFATLIPKQAQALTFHGEAGNVIDPFAPLSTFLEAMGDKIEDAGEFYYVPAVDFSASPDVVAEMEKVKGSVDAPPADRTVSPNIRQMIFSQKTTGEEELSDDTELTAKDWEFLRAVPTLLFLFVGGADGSITKGKRAAYRHVLDRRAQDRKNNGETMQRMIELAQEDIGGTLQKLTGSITNPRYYPETLGKLRELIDRKLSDSEAKKTKTGCVELAKKIALSSGRMFGAKVTPEEKAAVNLVQQTLGVKG